MAIKLPDEQSFGVRPSGRATRPVPNTAGVSRPVQRAARTQFAEAGVNELAGVAVAANAMADAHLRIQRRNDALGRADIEAKFKEAATTQLRLLETQEDLYDPNVLNSYQSFLEEQKNELLGSHDGLGDSQARLGVTLESLRSGYMDQAAKASLESGRTRVVGVIDEKINELAFSAVTNPGSLPQLFEAVDRVVDDYGDALPNVLMRAKVKNARSRLTEAAVGSLLTVGAVDSAIETLSLPGINAFLTPEAQSRLFLRIADASRTVEEDLVEVGDPSSPTGSRFVPKSQAMGMPGRPRQPLVQMNQTPPNKFLEELAGEDAKLVTEFTEKANSAQQTLSGVAVMRSALDSGRFRTGSLAELRMLVGRFGEFLGVEQDDAWQRWIGDAATAETLDSAATRLGLQGAEKLSRITNLSIEFIRQSLPALTKTTEGNRVLLEVMQRTAEREIEVADLMERYIATPPHTLRPENETSFYQAIRDLEERDPVIPPELRTKIQQTSRAAPSSFRQVLGSLTGNKPPEGVTIPEGYEFLRMQGEKVLIVDPQGNVYEQN